MNEKHEVAKKEYLPTSPIKQSIFVIQKREEISLIKDLATVYARSSLVPYSLRGSTPEITFNNVFIAMMHLHFIGADPVAHLHDITVIQGRPAIWGDLLKGLVLKSGLMVDYKEEYIEKDGEIVGAICTVKRKLPDGNVLTFTGKFTLEDARRAGLLNKDNWKKWPVRMLLNRARAFALRDGFADILGGLGIREELEDELVNEPSSEIEQMKVKLQSMSMEAKNETNNA